MTIIAIIILGLGLLLLAFGNRLAWFGAGVGALLGIGLLSLLPGNQSSLLWLIVPIGLAVVFALGAGFAKGILNIIILAFGALAGGAITLAVLDLFGLDLGLVGWLLALVGAVIGAVLASRFGDWAVIILSALVGALLAVRGLQMLLPAFQGILASLVGLLLAGGAIAYHGGLVGGRKQKSSGSSGA